MKAYINISLSDEDEVNSSFDGAAIDFASMLYHVSLFNPALQCAILLAGQAILNGTKRKEIANELAPIVREIAEKI